jgi:hypothetical protein
MTRKQSLEEAIETIARLGGIGASSLFAVTPVSVDCAGMVIMGIRWPEGQRLYAELKRLVHGLPEVADASCVALLPQVVDEIIATAQAASANQCRNGDGTRQATSRPIEARMRKGAIPGECDPVILP